MTAGVEDYQYALLWACALTVFGALPLLRAIPAQVIFGCLAVKLALPVIYFASHEAGLIWELPDAAGYYRQGLYLLGKGLSPVSFFTDGGVPMLAAFAGSQHILYGWFNLLSQWLVGPHYFAPVFGNVLLTMYCAWYVTRIAGFFVAERNYRLALFLFMALHWSVLSWSSFVNLKDSLVMTLTAAMLYYTLCLLVEIKARYVTGLIVVVFLLVWVRFYIPVIFFVCFSIHHVSCMIRTGRIRLPYIVVAGALLILLVMFFDVSRIGNAMAHLNFGPASMLYGVVRMVLTPLPTSVDEGYSFLQIASIMNVLFVVPMLLGAAMLRSKGREFDLLILYLVAMLLLYASFEEQQGARYRMQLVPIIAMMQFHFTWVFLRMCARPHWRIATSPPEPGGAA